MEWIWVVVLFAILLGPAVVLLLRRGRGEKLTQGPDSLMESYRSHFENWPRRKG
ncbi:MAG TPA: hypothetical protein VGS01_07025 [Candidatus Limnocylindria bacterium]|nr:hypothetical protein [Candidatus Limnocylindria bacterium]